MIVGYVEPSGESERLARAEIAGAARALGGAVTADDVLGLIRCELPDPPSLRALAARLALARRCLRRVRPGEEVGAALAAEGALGRSAEIRRVGRSPGAVDPDVRAWGRLYREAGGRIDLDHPERRFRVGEGVDGQPVLLEESSIVDRAAASARRMPRLPFQRPVSLAPRLARAAANLAELRAGETVVDPFVGTGALLAEAALLGGEVYGIDSDPAMIVGALRNFAHLGVTAAKLVEGDAGTVDLGPPERRYDAVLTDPPYGRSSATGGETRDEILARVLPRWAARLRAGGRLVVVVPSGTPPLPVGGSPEAVVPVRVHRSLTREFRLYRSPGNPSTDPSGADPTRTSG